MAKFVNETHITGERGVIVFSEYCNKHKPYIIFREVTKNDFGIDGEVEIVRTNEEGKKEATGEILKVQIKSTASDKGYIKRETEEEIDFQAKKEDIEYWSKYSLEVLLVLYDDRTESLYCKKIDKIDLAKSKLKKSQPVIFNKKDNLLEIGDDSFVEKYSYQFKQRINFDTSETLLSNILNFRKLPTMIFRYESKYTTKKKIFEVITNDDAPVFFLNHKYIYSFFDLSELSNDFKEKILDSELKETFYKKEIWEDRVLRNHFVELINEYLKAHLYSKRMKYNKDYKRFYFAKPHDKDSREISYKARRRENTIRTVVNTYEYGKDKFYRHTALGVEYFFDEDNLFLILNPKYLFTNDGTEILSPEKITKYTNYITAREFNNQILNTVHFFYEYLANIEDGICLHNYNKHEITIGKYISFYPAFGIPLDTKKQLIKKEENQPHKLQAKLF